MGWRTGRPVPQGSWGTWATIEYEGKWKEENCPPPKGTGGRKNQKKITAVRKAKERFQKTRQFAIAQAYACIDEYIRREVGFFKVRDAIADVLEAYSLPCAYHPKMVEFNTVWIIAEMTYFNRDTKKMCCAPLETLREIVARIGKEGAGKTKQKTETKKAANTKNDPGSLKTEKTKQGGTKDQSSAEKEEEAGDRHGNTFAEDTPLMRLYREWFEQTRGKEDRCEPPDIRRFIRKIGETDRELSSTMMRDMEELRLLAIQALCGECSKSYTKQQFDICFRHYIGHPYIFATGRDIRTLHLSMIGLLGKEEFYKVFSEILCNIVQRAMEKKFEEEQRKTITE